MIQTQRINLEIHIWWLSIELQTDQRVNGQWIGGSRGKDWGMLSKPCQPRVGMAREGEIDCIHTNLPPISNALTMTLFLYFSLEVWCTAC